MNDDGTRQNVSANFPVVYSGQPVAVTSTDQLVSQRIADGRYLKNSADSNLTMNSKKITGLVDASAAEEAVHYG